MVSEWGSEWVSGYCLTQSEPLLTYIEKKLFFDSTNLWSYSLLREEASKFFVLTWRGIKPTNYCSWREHPEHYNTDVVVSTLNITTLTLMWAPWTLQHWRWCEHPEHYNTDVDVSTLNITTLMLMWAPWTLQHWHWCEHPEHYNTDVVSVKMKI